jgi:hypothetical protein
MKVKEVNYQGDRCIMIYITEGEKGSLEVNEKINSYKSLYSNVTIFTSGRRNIEDTLINIIKNNAT